ncbi:minor tail protein [Microbacterium phage phiMiGM15]
MSEGSADLSGSGNQRVWINCYRTGQNYDGNFTSYYGEVRYYGNGYGSWTESTLYWSANFGGHAVSGQWNIPYARRNDQYTVLWSGYFNRGHDGNGFGSGFTSRADINASAHGSIGTGWVQVGEETPPRIPKPPQPPNSLRVLDVTATSFGVAYNRGDDMGAGIVQDQAHWYAYGPAGAGTMIWDDAYPQGYTNPHNGAGPSLVPGTKHYVYVRSRNSRGWSGWAGPIEGETLAGGRIKWDGAYKTAVPWVKTGGVWRRARPFVRSGGAWRPTR